MTSWKDQFQSITDSVIVSDGINDFTNDRHSNSGCGCQPKSPGERICRDSRCINFSTQTECTRCREGCCNKRIQNREYAKLDVLSTPGKGHGLFAAEDLKKNQFVREYVGELISTEEFTRRRNERGQLLEHQYIMSLKNGVYLDASRKGSISRFINHSCEPNCYVEVWTVQNRLRVGIFTMHDIPNGTELTFDYKWEPSSRPPTKCHCGTKSCRGYLEILSREELEDLKVRRGLWRKGGAPITGRAPSRSTGQNGTSRTNTLVPSTSEQGSVDIPITTEWLTAPSPTSDHGFNHDDDKPSRTAGASKTTGTDGPNTPLPGDVYNAQGQLVPSSLIGRRVKVWWEGNLAYLEADVESYNPKTNLYLCRYPFDDSTSEEDLGPSVVGSLLPSSSRGPSHSASTASLGSGASLANGEGAAAVGGSGLALAGATKWFWLDETAEESVIRKKANGEAVLTDDHDDLDESPSNSAPRRSTTNITNAAYNLNRGAEGHSGGGAAVTVLQRAVEVVTTAAAQELADMYRPGMPLTMLSGCAFVSISQYSAWQNLQQIASLNYQVRTTLLSEESDPSGGSRRVVLSGQPEAIAALTEVLRQATQRSQRYAPKVDESLRKQVVALRNRQSVVMTQDWRFRPDVPVTTAPASGKSIPASMATTAFDAYVVQHLSEMPGLDGYLSPAHLPVGVNAVSNLVRAPPTAGVATGGDAVTETVRRSLLAHMQGLTARLGFSAQASLQAYLLLVRYLRFVPSLAMKDSLAILASIAVLVAKGSADFKYKQVPQIVHGAYCQVFNRDESEVEVASVQPYLGVCLEREHAVYAAVQRDLFSADLVPLTQSFLRTSMYRQRWYFDHDPVLSGAKAEGANGSGHKDRHRDREAEHARRKQIATFQLEVGVRSTVRRTVLSVAEGLAQELLCLRSNTAVVQTNGNGHANGGADGTGELSSGSILVLSAVPVPVLQVSCLLLICHLYRSLPSGSAHRRTATELAAFSAELAAFTADILHMPALAVQWCVELLVEACIEYLPSLDYLEPFRELRDTVPPLDQVQLLRERVPADVERSLASPASGRPPTAGHGASTQATNGATAVGQQSAPSFLKPSTTPTTGSSTNTVAGQCRARFPWLASDSTVLGSGLGPDAAVVDHSAVCLEMGVSWADLQGGERMSTDDKNHLHGDAVVVECSKDLYFSLASIHTDAAKFLPRLECPSNNSRDGAGRDLGLVSLRSWPSVKALDKEISRAGVQEAYQLGAVQSALRELTLLQHLHHFYTPRDETANTEGAVAGESPSFVAPVGVVTLTSGEFGRSPALRRALLGEGGEGGDGNGDLSAPTAPQYPWSLSSTRAVATASTAVKYDLQYLAFPAVHISLARVLGLNTPPSSPRWEITRSHLETLRSGSDGNQDQSQLSGALLQTLQSNKGHLLPAAFAVELVRDLFSAVAHMIACGVYLRWLGVDHLYLTSGGKLQVGGLSGAIQASYAATSHCDTSQGVLHGTNRATADGPLNEDVFSLAALNDRLSAHKHHHQSGSKSTSHKAPKPRHKRKFSLNPFDDDDDDEDNNNTADRQQARLRSMAKKLGFPRAALYTVAPEVLMGAGASPESSVYAAAAVAVQLLTGKPLVKNATSEEKQVQYLYRILGTPKAVGYGDFDALPLGALYGKTIVDEQEDKHSESRSRVHKVLKEQCPSPLLALFSFSAPQPDAPIISSGIPEKVSPNHIALSDARKVLTSAGQETDHEGVLDFLRASLQLVPSRRLLPETLLQFALFRRPSTVLSAASPHLLAAGKTSRCLEFRPCRLTLTGGLTFIATTLVPKSRLDAMVDTIACVRALQRVSVPEAVARKDTFYTPATAEEVEKWAIMDEVLFREENAKVATYPALPSTLSGPAAAVYKASPVSQAQGNTPSLPPQPPSQVQPQAQAQAPLRIQPATCQPQQQQYPPRPVAPVDPPAGTVGAASSSYTYGLSAPSPSPSAAQLQQRQPPYGLSAPYPTQQQQQRQPHGPSYGGYGAPVASLHAAGQQAAYGMPIAASQPAYGMPIVAQPPAYGASMFGSTPHAAYGLPIAGLHQAPRSAPPPPPPSNPPNPSHLSYTSYPTPSVGPAPVPAAPLVPPPPSTAAPSEDGADLKRPRVD